MKSWEACGLQTCNTGHWGLFALLFWQHVLFGDINRIPSMHCNGVTLPQWLFVLLCIFNLYVDQMYCMVMKKKTGWDGRSTICLLPAKVQHWAHWLFCCWEKNIKQQSNCFRELCKTHILDTTFIIIFLNSSLRIIFFFLLQESGLF